MSPSTPARPARTLGRWLAAVTVPVVATAALLAPGADWQHHSGTARQASSTAAAPTQFRVANFNVLGYSHTKPGGDRYPKYAGGNTRMLWTTQLMAKHDVEMIGFQEFEPPQYDKFKELMGSSWDVWPGRAFTDSTSESVAWRTKDWTAIQRLTYKSPYFYGHLRIHPLVKLRNNHTGQLVWLMNTHNPADTRGDAQQWRDAAERIQAKLVNKLQAADPDIPVLFTGDMNDREKFYCPMTYLTDLESASGGVHGEPADGDPYLCQPHLPMIYDWIMGTSNIGFSGYTEDDSDFVDKTSDHAFVFANASIAPQPARAAGVKRVVVIDIQGLRSNTVKAGRAPFLSSLVAQGAATFQARADNDNRLALPNTISLLSSRPVATTIGGHGVTSNRYSGPSVHAAAGQYVSSIYDMAHNLGMRTAFYSGDARSKLVTRTWDSSLAGSDKYGVDNGRGKIDGRLISTSDADPYKAARQALTDRPARITVLQLGDVLRAGERYGWHSTEYVRAVSVADTRLRRLVGGLQGTASTAGSTLVVVTASVPGAPVSTYGYGVPLVVWGPSVPHADLYAMNPQYTRPAGSQRLPATGTPINTGVIANLAASALTLPAIPRSRFDAHLRLGVFGP